MTKPLVLVPKRYLPETLSDKDRRTQRASLRKSRMSYKIHRFVSRPTTLSSYPHRKSPHVRRAMKMYKVHSLYPGKKLAIATGCNLKALQQIVRKGRGAYFSSGSRPNQTADSWGYARLASAITGQNASVVDRNILESGCTRKSRALRLARQHKQTLRKAIHTSL
jgi:hypothetical protein